MYSSEGLTYLRDHYFKQQKEELLIITKKNSDPNHNYIDEKSAVNEFIKQRCS